MADTNPDAVKVLTDDEVSVIEARANAATEAPWTAYYRISPRGAHKQWHIGNKDGLCQITMHGYEQDYQFMAHAREDIPALCQTVRALRELLNDASETDSRCRELLKTYDRSSPDGIIPLDEVVEAMQSDVNTTLREPYAALIEHQGVLVDENTALREQLAQLTQERDKWRRKYERIDIND